MPLRPPRFRQNYARPREHSPSDQRGSASARGYGAQWRALRKMHLAAHPLCVFCLTHGRTVRGNVVDHIKPHKGNRALLFDPANLQTLCKTCHDSTKQRMEKGGFLRVSEDGTTCREGEGGQKV